MITMPQLLQIKNKWGRVEKRNQRDLQSQWWLKSCRGKINTLKQKGKRQEAILIRAKLQSPLLVSRTWWPWEVPMAQQRHSWTFGFLFAHLQLSCPHIAAFAAAAFTLSTTTSGELDLYWESHCKVRRNRREVTTKDSIFSLHGSGTTQQ